MGPDVGLAWSVSDLGLDLVGPCVDWRQYCRLQPSGSVGLADICAILYPLLGWLSELHSFALAAINFARFDPASLAHRSGHLVGSRHHPLVN